jgi:hypothetical protein
VLRGSDPRHGGHAAAAIEHLAEYIARVEGLGAARPAGALTAD